MEEVLSTSFYATEKRNEDGEGVAEGISCADGGLRLKVKGMGSWWKGACGGGLLRDFGRAVSDRPQALVARKACCGRV